MGDTNLVDYRTFKMAGKDVFYMAFRAHLIHRYSRNPHVSAREQIRLLKLNHDGKLKRSAWTELTTRFKYYWAQVVDPSGEEARGWALKQVPKHMRERLFLDEERRGSRTPMLRILRPSYFTQKKVEQGC